MNTLDKLKQIPDLAAQVQMSPATPYRVPAVQRAPGGKSLRQGGKVSSGPVPASILAEDMLSTTGLLFELTQAVRMVWEQQDAPRTLLAEDVSFAGECEWLISTAEFWQADPVLAEWVRDTANRVHRQLARWVGEVAPSRLVCPTCGGRVALDDYTATGEGTKQAACSACGVIWHPEDIATDVVLYTPARLPVIAELLGIGLRTLQRWAKSGDLPPVTSHTPAPNTPHLYLPAKAKQLAAKPH